MLAAGLSVPARWKGKALKLWLIPLHFIPRPSPIRKEPPAAQLPPGPAVAVVAFPVCDSGITDGKGVLGQFVCALDGAEIVLFCIVNLSVSCLAPLTGLHGGAALQEMGGPHAVPGLLHLPPILLMVGAGVGQGPSPRLFHAKGITSAFTTSALSFCSQHKLRTCWHRLLHSYRPRLRWVVSSPLLPKP